MKTSKKLLATAIATLAVGGIAPVANAELSASATVASSYLVAWYLIWVLVHQRFLVI